MNKKNNTGFTIFEVIIVIAILAILGAVVISDYVSGDKVNKDTKKCGGCSCGGKC